MVRRLLNVFTVFLVGHLRRIVYYDVLPGVGLLRANIGNTVGINLAMFLVHALDGHL